MYTYITYTHTHTPHTHTYIYVYIYINYAIASNTSCNSLALFTGIATVNKEMFIDILRWFKDAVRRKDPEKWRTSSWVLLHNAPAHKSVLNKDFSAKINATTLERPHTLLTQMQLIFTCSLD